MRFSNFGLHVQLFGEGAKRGADQASDRQPVVQYPQLGVRLLPKHQSSTLVCCFGPSYFEQYFPEYAIVHNL